MSVSGGYIKCKDIENKDLLYDPDLKYQVMMEWEKPYMERLIDHLKPRGHVLEIGFGLGYSANQIQKYNIKSHTIIEPEKSVIKELKEWSSKQKNKVNIIEGYWQNVLHTLDKFDCIFFDDAPTQQFKDPEGIRIYKFFYLLLNNHVNKDAKMTWYCDQNLKWLSHPATEFSIKPYKIKIPKHCNYVNNDTLYLPLINFREGIINDLHHLAVTKDFIIKKI